MKFDASPDSYFCFCLGLLPMIVLFFIYETLQQGDYYIFTLLQLEKLGLYICFYDTVLVLYW